MIFVFRELTTLRGRQAIKARVLDEMTGEPSLEGMMVSSLGGALVSLLVSRLSLIPITNPTSNSLMIICHVPLHLSRIDMN